MPTKKPIKPQTGTVFQLKIMLKDVKPPIWRRVVTRDCTLAKLNDILQVSMGWQDSHLHLFAIGGERFGLPDQWEPEFKGDEGAEDSRTVKHQCWCFLVSCHSEKPLCLASLTKET
jgi:Plasmid pRiA4b ORF-3-like protein